MPDLTARGSVSDTVQGFFNYTLVGTALGTVTISTEPTLLHSIFFPTRVAGSIVTLYDSVGTSGTVIGTITLGTQPGYDPAGPYILDYRTKNGLTVVNSANLGVLVANI